MDDMDQEEQQKQFDLIWRRYPEKFNRTSTDWWFFLLLPKQAGGYGPSQAMFTLVSRAGDSFSFNHRSHAGLDRQVRGNGEGEHFPALAYGWYFDGRDMHENLVHHSSTAVLSPKGSIEAWTEAEDGKKLGGGIRSFGDKPFGLQAEFSDINGGIRFEAWGDPRSRTTAPGHVYDYNYKPAGFYVQSWRRLQFAGEVTHPNGTERLEGIGYFQRVNFNVPLFPWKWIYAAFEDGSIFSCTTPYIGPHLLRRGDRFFPGGLEKATLPIIKGAFFHWQDARETVVLNKVKVTPIAGDKYPTFTVECSSPAGDFIRFEIVPYTHLQILVDHPLMNGRWFSRFNYNEYPFRVANLEGVAGGRALDSKTLGQGFGNCEYTWGLGL